MGVRSILLRLARYCIVGVPLSIGCASSTSNQSAAPADDAASTREALCTRIDKAIERVDSKESPTSLTSLMSCTIPELTLITSFYECYASHIEAGNKQVDECLTDSPIQMGATCSKASLNLLSAPAPANGLSAPSACGASRGGGDAQCSACPYAMGCPTAMGLLGGCRW